MASRRRRRSLAAIALGVVASVSVEMSRANQLVSCNSETEWMDNASGESPCTVALFLMLPCVPDSETDFLILPLNSSVRSYGNPLEGQWCTCNSVVYNLMSACAVCQDGLPTDFTTWTSGCSDVTYDYPNNAVAQSYSTPQWAYVNVTERDSFNLEAAQEVAGGKKGWSAIQIALPIAIGVAVALLAGVIFYFYRRRLKRRYSPIADPYLSRPTHMYNDSRSYSQQSIPQSRPGHQHVASSSSLGLHSIVGRSSPAPTRKKSAASVAWERARMHAPRKLGGLLPDRPKVHARTRGADWSIDVDPGDLTNDHYDPWHSGSGSGSDPRSSRTGLHSKEASGESQAQKETPGSHSARSRPSGHARSESQLGLLSDTSPERLQRIQDSPNLNKKPSTPSFVRGIIDGISGIGLGLGSRPVAVVSRPRRGFNVDDVDSASSPTVLNNAREGRVESFVFVERETDAEAGPGTNTLPAGKRTNLSLATLGSPSIGEKNPTQSGSSGGRTRSDGSGESGGSGSGSGNSEERRRERESVVLISRSPGQDFNSMASPVTTEGSTGFGAFIASSEHGNWSAALTDTSSVLSPSFSRADRLASVPPAPPPTSQTYSNNNTPTHSAPGTPGPPSRILIPHGNGNNQLLVPPAVRAAGGYSNTTQPTQSALLAPDPLVSAASLASTAVLPNTRLFSGAIAESVVAEPPSAVSGLGTVSEHSGSTDAYTVPNPFTFDHRRGGSAGAANALRLASPALRSTSRTDFIE